MDNNSDIVSGNEFFAQMPLGKFKETLPKANVLALVALEETLVHHIQCPTHFAQLSTQNQKNLPIYLDLVTAELDSRTKAEFGGNIHVIEMGSFEELLEFIEKTAENIVEPSSLN